MGGWGVDYVHAARAVFQVGGSGECGLGARSCSCGTAVKGKAGESFFRRGNISLLMCCAACGVFNLDGGDDGVLCESVDNGGRARSRDGMEGWSYVFHGLAGCPGASRSL